jgi:hypothetical protein
VPRTPRQLTPPVNRGSPTTGPPSRTLLLSQKGLTSQGSSLGGRETRPPWLHSQPPAPPRGCPSQGHVQLQEAPFESDPIFRSAFDVRRRHSGRLLAVTQPLRWTGRGASLTNKLWNTDNPPGHITRPLRGVATSDARKACTSQVSHRFPEKCSSRRRAPTSLPRAQDQLLIHPQPGCWRVSGCSECH